MASPLLSIPEIQENQSGKYITHNEALALLEGIVTRVLSRSNNGAPSSPSEGDTYVVDDNSGDWSEASIGDIAHYYSGAWHFVTPVEGLSIWCVDEGATIYFDGSVWVIDFTSRINFNITVSNQDAVGVVDKFIVDSNSYGFGAALRMASDGNLEEANATDDTTMPCIALALDTGTGSGKQVLFWGRIRNDNWNWAPGDYIYVDLSAGSLTQSIPSNAGNVVQVLGVALSSTQILFNPSYATVTRSS